MEDRLAAGHRPAEALAVEQVDPLVADVVPGLPQLAGEVSADEPARPGDVDAHPVHHADVAKTLYLLRHLKSSWDDETLVDHDRPLAPRGRKAGKKIARYLRDTGVRPELVLCSSAVRTRQTLTAVEAELGEPEIRFVDELYHAWEATLFTVLQAVEPDIDSVLLIGHNPGLLNVTVMLAGDLPDGFPTGAVATLSLDGTWVDLAPATCRLAAYVVPREL
jgi:phosphohistidine phosphatase